jgi:hypothetical protein
MSAITILIIWIVLITVWNVILQLNLNDVKDEVKRERKINFKHRFDRRAHDNI